MARIIWALLVKGGTYRTPTAPAQADHDREDVRASGRRVWRDSRRDGAGTTRAFHCASSTLRVIWTQSANSHTGPRLSSCRIKAGQMTASDHAQHDPNVFPCLEGGVHRWKPYPAHVASSLPRSSSGETQEPS